MIILFRLPGTSWPRQALRLVAHVASMDKQGKGKIGMKLGR